jgi:protein-L-isoaspartate(D-aspartate) O-methyltransferase
VLDVMRNLPRHIFVDEALASRAYEDTALPIGSGQTISQPYIVARMTEILMANQPNKVLEVGTGCGYQTAVLASLVDTVYSIERISALLSKAHKHLIELRIGNAQLKLGDGYQGWPEHAPFDGILLTAAPVKVPQTLLAQLADGGCLVAPVGDANGQSLLAITRKGDHFEQQELELVSFVPMLTGTKT